MRAFDPPAVARDPIALDHLERFARLFDPLSAGERHSALAFVVWIQREVAWVAIRDEPAGRPGRRPVATTI